MYDPASLSKYFDVNNNALLSQHQKICNDMNIMIQLCSNKYRILKNIKSVWAASLEESKGFYFKGQVMVAKLQLYCFHHYRQYKFNLRANERKVEPGWGGVK